MQDCENTNEVDILLGKNSGVWISTHKIFEHITGEYLFDYHDILNDSHDDASICTFDDSSMRIFVFIKSPDLDNDLHYDFDKFYPNIEDILRRKTIGYVSAHDDKVIRTSQLVIYAKCDCENDNFNSSDFEKMTSQEKIKYLDDNKYKKFKLVCGERDEGNNKLKLVDAENPATVVQSNIVENFGGVLRQYHGDEHVIDYEWGSAVGKDDFSEYVTDDQFKGKIKLGTEFHLNEPGDNSCTSYPLGHNMLRDHKKLVILGKETGFAFSDFYRNRSSVLSQRSIYLYSLFSTLETFYLPFKGKALIDVLSCCVDNKINHKNLNMTIAIMHPEICGGFQTVIDDISSTETIEQYLEKQKLSRGKNCFVKFKLSDLTKNDIAKILEYQNNGAITFENFIDDISKGGLGRINYQSKVAKFLEKYLPNWLFRFLDWLFNFKKVKIALQLTEENNLEKSVSQINNQDDNIVNKTSNENNDRLVNKNHINESPKEKNNLNKAISQINNQDDNIVNKTSNENEDNVEPPLLNRQVNENII